jgi:hypothetical protein
MTPPTTRAQRLAMPLARNVVRGLAVEHGACTRPVQLRRTDLDTGQVEQVLVPCGHTLASVCLSCAERAKSLRAAQCREGWHLDTEPAITPDEPDDLQRMWTGLRADTQRDRDHAAADGQDTSDLDEAARELDEEITQSGIRGNVLPGRPARRHRSTRRRQDAPDLPRRPVAPATIGKTYTAPGGTRYRPSMFLTLTCDSYGKVSADGTPVNPGSYDYQRAARDALHFAALFDRLIQNLRRFTGYDLQTSLRLNPSGGSPARARRDPRHRVPHRTAAGPRRDLPPGLVATHPHRPARRRTPARLARGIRPLPRPRHRRVPARLGRGPRRHRAGRRTAARR